MGNDFDGYEDQTRAGVIAVILRFFQSWALLFAIVAASIAPRVLLPADSALWLVLGVRVGAALLVYLLLHKDGFTTNRPPKPPKRIFSR